MKKALSLLTGIPVQEIEAPYFDTKPVIDGVVSVQEWGEASAYVSQADVDDSKVILPTDTPEANDLNTFFYRNPARTFDVEQFSMEYTLWLRWDEDYFYIAAKVKDKDGHSLKSGKKATWDGDALQVRVDPEGYNAVCPLGA